MRDDAFETLASTCACAELLAPDASFLLTQAILICLLVAGGELHAAMGFKSAKAEAQLSRHPSEQLSEVEQRSERRGKAAKRVAKHAVKQAKQLAKRQRKARNQRAYLMRCRESLRAQALENLVECQEQLLAARLSRVGVGGLGGGEGAAVCDDEATQASEVWADDFGDADDGLLFDSFESFGGVVPMRENIRSSWHWNENARELPLLAAQLRRLPRLPAPAKLRDAMEIDPFELQIAIDNLDALDEHPASTRQSIQQVFGELRHALYRDGAFERADAVRPHGAGAIGAQQARELYLACQECGVDSFAASYFAEAEAHGARDPNRRPFLEAGSSSAVAARHFHTSRGVAGAVLRVVGSAAAALGIHRSPEPWTCNTCRLLQEWPVRMRAQEAEMARRFEAAGLEVLATAISEHCILLDAATITSLVSLQLFGKQLQVEVSRSYTLIDGPLLQQFLPSKDARDALKYLPLGTGKLARLIGADAEECRVAQLMSGLVSEQSGAARLMRLAELLESEADDDDDDMLSFLLGANGEQHHHGLLYMHTREACTAIRRAVANGDTPSVQRALIKHPSTVLAIHSSNVHAMDAEACRLAASFKRSASTVDGLLKRRGGAAGCVRRLAQLFKHPDHFRRVVCDSAIDSQHTTVAFMSDALVSRYEAAGPASADCGRRRNRCTGTHEFYAPSRDGEGTPRAYEATAQMQGAVADVDDMRVLMSDDLLQTISVALAGARAAGATAVEFRASMGEYEAAACTELLNLMERGAAQLVRSAVSIADGVGRVGMDGETPDGWADRSSWALEEARCQTSTRAEVPAAALGLSAVQTYWGLTYGHYDKHIDVLQSKRSPLPPPTPHIGTY